MPDEGQTAPDTDQDQPVSEAPPNEGSAQEGFTDVDLNQKPDEITSDWLQERYDQMQRDYTQKTQGLAEQRKVYEDAGFTPEFIEALQDPETKEQAFAALASAYGYEVGGEEDQEEEVDEFEDEDAPLTRAEFQAFQEQQQQREFQEDQDALVGALDEHVGELQKKADVTFTDRQLYAIKAEAWNQGNPTPEQTTKVFNDWAADLKQVGDAALEAHRDQKRGAPSPPKTGSSGTPEIDVNDPRQRLKRANEVAAQALDGG